MSRLAPWIVRLAALWLLTGACYKFFAGSPADLPPILRGAPFGLAANFKLAIAIELAVGTLALLVPRLGWFLLSGALVVFVAILVQLLAAGEASCGCFGANGPPPAVMLAVDAALLALLAASRPWRLPKEDGEPKTLLLWLVLATLGVAAPFIKFREREPLAPAITVDEVTGEKRWSLPLEDSWPQHVIPEIGQWVGQPVGDTELGVWFDTSLWPTEATGILWRRSCAHCATHLRELAEKDDGSTIYVLIRLPGDEDQDPVVDQRPLVFPEYDLVFPGPEFIVTTPVEFRLEGGVVTSLRDDFTDEE